MEPQQLVHGTPDGRGEEAVFESEGQGEVLLKPGDCVLQPPGIRHDLTACSDDMELVETTSPAEFGTEPA